jgi:hypothetical protein
MWPTANEVPRYNDTIYFILLKVVQHGFQSRQVAVNVRHNC